MCGEVFTKVAERVYAKVATRDINELTPWTGDDKHPYNLPSVKSGLRTISESALTNLGVSYESKTAEWVRFGVEKESGKLLADENRLVPGLVPDVVGMGAIDAIYLMENSGLEVEIKGVGAVKSQSIKAGEEVQKGAIVVLEME